MTPLISLQEYLYNARNAVNGELDSLLPPVVSGDYPETVHSAMKYAVLNGGKRLRPIVAIAVGEMLGYRSRSLVRISCAVELIHSCSLILDDLPCMDDAEMRRGKKTCHLVYGEHVAILAALALLNMAYRIIFESGQKQRIQNKIGTLLTDSVGTGGIIGGQLVDLESEGKSTDFETIEYIHSHKTGALFTASALLGGIIAGASDKELTALEMYAKNLGLAFQIKDDLLDITGHQSQTGKDSGKDQNKATFISHAGVEGAGRLLAELVDFSISSLERFGSRATRLVQISEYVKERTN